METVVAIANHRNHHQYYGRNCRHILTKYCSPQSAPSSSFLGINCRTFQSGAGLLPTPFKSCSTATPVTKRPSSASVKSQTPSPSVINNPQSLKRTVKRSTSPIPIRISLDKNEVCFSLSDRWAGPTYSNSPPPSSLPMPKFPMQPYRTVSLELPKLASEIDFHPIAKSAPATPTWLHRPSSSDLFDNADSATKTLRHILNLDVSDE